MQILHPFVGSVRQYFNEIADPDRYRPDHCPQCEAHQPLSAHGFYSRTLVDVALDGVIRVRRYLCRCCRRTISLLPEFALPYLRFSITVIALFLIARLLGGNTLNAAAVAATLPHMPYQRGQFWVLPFPEPDRTSMRHPGGAHRRTIGAALRCQGPAHVAVHRLGGRPPVSVRPPATPPAGMASVSRSRRATRRAASRGTARLRRNT